MGEVRCPSFGHLAGHARERERGAFNEEVGGSVWSLLEIWEKMEFWKMEKLVACGGRKEIKEKEKGKEIHMRRYFLGLKK